MNLQRELDKITEDAGGKTLLLHACCAPCSSYTLEYLAKHFDITLFFYNPNIMPQTEYTHRLAELRRLVAQMPELSSIKIIDSEYNPDDFLEIAKGLEAEPEGGERCAKCFRLRLEQTAKLAKKLHTDYFTTTLSISPHKDAQLLDNIASELAEEYNIQRLPSDFKKKGGYQRSIELSKEYDLYRQSWCGCPFSKTEREKELGNE